MKQIILTNYRLKITAIIIATLLWWFLYSEHHPQFQTVLPVHIQYNNLPISMRIVSAPEIQRMKLRGDPEELNNIAGNTITAVADLAGLDVEGMHQIEVNITNNSLARIINRDTIVPVELVRLNKIEMPVKYRFYGSLPLGLKLGQVTGRVKVSIYGSTDELARVKFVVAGIDLTERHNSFTEKVVLQAVGENGNPIKDIKLEPRQIVAQVPVEKESVLQVPIVLRYKADTADVNVERVEFYPEKVSLVGAKDTLSHIKSISTEEFDLSLCSAGGFFSIRLVYPNDLNASVDRVTISCEPPEEVTRSFIVNLKALNMCESCTCKGCRKTAAAGTVDTLLPQSIEVVTTGPNSLVNSINISDIYAAADMKGLEPGTHEVDVIAKLKADLENVDFSYSPEFITITIQKQQERNNTSTNDGQE